MQNRYFLIILSKGSHNYAETISDIGCNKSMIRHCVICEFIDKVPLNCPLVVESTLLTYNQYASFELCTLGRSVELGSVIVKQRKRTNYAA